MDQRHEIFRIYIYIKHRKNAQYLFFSTRSRRHSVNIQAATPASNRLSEIHPAFFSQTVRKKFIQGFKMILLDFPKAATIHSISLNGISIKNRRNIFQNQLTDNRTGVWIMILGKHRMRVGPAFSGYAIQRGIFSVVRKNIPERTYRNSKLVTIV